MTRWVIRNLIESLDGASAPEGGFVASRINDTSEIRVGRRGTNIAVLIPAQPGSTSEPDMRLENLSVRHCAQCSIVDGELHWDGTFGIIECTSQDSDIRDTFIDVIDWLLPVDGDITVSEAKSFFARVIRLFREPEAGARTSAMGLWGELFVMRSAASHQMWALAWHLAPRDRWDFSFGHLRVEVKTSSSMRRHHFSLDQLLPPPSASLYVVSILTTSLSSGPSIRELLEEVVADIGPAERARTVETAIASLGTSWIAGSNARFDDLLAAESLRVFRSDDIPRVPDPPSEVAEVRFVVDLSEVDSLGRSVIVLDQEIRRGIKADDFR